MSDPFEEMDRDLSGDTQGAIEAAAARFGLRKTSGLRSVAHNAAVGGVPNSYHVRGQADDFAGAPDAMKQFHAYAKANYGDRLEEAIHGSGDHTDHVHIAWKAPQKSSDPFAAMDRELGGKSQQPADDPFARMDQELEQAAPVASRTAKPVKPTAPAFQEDPEAEHQFELAKAEGNTTAVARHALTLRSKGYEVGQDADRNPYQKRPEGAPAPTRMDRSASGRRRMQAAPVSQPVPPNSYGAKPVPDLRAPILRVGGEVGADVISTIGSQLGKYGSAAYDLMFRPAGMILHPDSPEEAAAKARQDEINNELKALHFKVMQTDEAGPAEIPPEILSRVQELHQENEAIAHRVEQERAKKGVGHPLTEASERFGEEHGLPPGIPKNIVRGATGMAIPLAATALTGGAAAPVVMGGLTAAERYGEGQSPGAALESGLISAASVAAMGGAAGALDRTTLGAASKLAGRTLANTGIGLGAQALEGENAIPKTPEERQAFISARIFDVAFALMHSPHGKGLTEEQAVAEAQKRVAQESTPEPEAPRRVSHPDFGEGVIAPDQRGVQQAYVRVNFDDGRTKLILAAGKNPKLQYLKPEARAAVSPETQQGTSPRSEQPPAAATESATNRGVEPEPTVAGAPPLMDKSSDTIAEKRAAEAVSAAETSQPGATIEPAVESRPPAITSAEQRLPENAPLRAAVDRVKAGTATPEDHTLVENTLYRSDVVDLPNLRAYSEAPKKPIQGMSDVDGLSWVNDKLGHDNGDVLLRAKAQALKDEGVDAYHVSGDEFRHQFDTQEEADTKLKAVAERLKGATLRFTDANKDVHLYKGADFSYGVGTDAKQADASLLQHKDARRESGERASAKGERPPGLVEVPGGEGRPDEGRHAGGYPSSPGRPGEAERSGAGPAGERPQDVASDAEPGTVHKFSSTQVDLPDKQAKAVRALGRQIPHEDLAGDGRETEPHITVKYGLHTGDAEKVREALANEGLVTATIGKTSAFKGVEDGTADAVIAEVDSPDLHRLNKVIADALPHTDTHPDYKPHVTVAYVKPGLGEKYSGRTELEGQKVTLSEIAFTGKNGDTVTIPLGSKAATEEAAHHSEFQPRDEGGHFDGPPEFPPDHPNYPAGSKERALPKTLDAARLESAENRTYTPQTIAGGIEAGRATVKEIGLDVAIERVRTGEPGIDWAPTGYAALEELRNQERALRSTDPKAADALIEKRNVFLNDFVARATSFGQAIVGVKAVEQFAPDRAAYLAEQMSKKARGKGISSEESARLTRAGEELEQLQDRIKAQDVELARLKSEAKKKAGPANARKTSEYQARLEEQGSAAKTTLAAKLGNLDFGTLAAAVERPHEVGAVRNPFGTVLPGDAELIAQYAASRLNEGTVADLNTHLIESFGPEVEPYLGELRRRAYAIRQEARLAELADVETRPARTATILQEIQAEIGERNRQIKEGEDARRKAQKEAKLIARQRQRTQADIEARARRIQEGIARDAEIEEARTRKAQVAREYREASQAQRKAYQEQIKNERQVEKQASFWDKPLRDAAAEARQRLATATDPQVAMDDLVSVAVESLLPSKPGGAPRTRAILPADFYVDLKREFPHLVTRKTQGKIFKLALQRAKDAVGASREAARMRSAGAEERRLWETLGEDVDAQAVLIQRAETQRRQIEARNALAQEFARVSRTRLKSAAFEVSAASRALFSSIDAPLGRQGLLYTVMHPVQTMRYAVPATMRGYALSREGFRAESEKFQRHPDFELAKRAGVDFTGLASEVDPRIAAEEQFQSALAERLPWTRRSEQAFSLGMNAQRLAVFSRYADFGRSQGYSLESNPEFFQQAAKTVNVMTGRGDLTLKQKQLAALTNQVIFSTRLNISRVQAVNRLFNPLAYRKLDPAMKRVMVGEAIRLVAGMGLIYGTARLAGFKVTADPDDSDFGKIRIGKTTYDVTGGEAGTVRFLYRFVRGVAKQLAGEEIERKDEPWEIATRYGRQKLAPIPGAAISYLGRKDAIGKPANLNFEPLSEGKAGIARAMSQNILIKMVLPGVINDFQDALTEEGWVGGVKALPALAGLGTQTFTPGEPRKEIPTPPPGNIAERAYRQFWYQPSGTVARGPRLF